MKKLIIAGFFIVLPALLFGQYEPKGKVTKAQVALDQGKLDIAKAEIDKAFELNVKGKVTKAAKNWYLKGKIYKAILLDSGEFHNLDDNALNIAVESLNKVKEMEKENSSYYIFANQEIEQIYAVVLNGGAAKYGENDFKGAYDEFMLALTVHPNDTIALLYGGVAAQQAEMIDEALACYESLSQLGKADEDTYKTMLYLSHNVKKDYENVLRIARDAQKKYPGNEVFRQEELNALILLERDDEAESELKKTIENDPNNSSAYFQLGYLYDKQEKVELAVKYYTKAVEVDPDNYEANFNAGVVFYNQGGNILKKLNNMSLKEFNENEDKYVEDANIYFRKAVPYLEKAAEIKPEEDIVLLETLEGVYIRLKMQDKVDSIEKRIKALKGE